MKQLTPVEMGEEMGRLAIVYQHLTPSKERSLIWFNALRDIPREYLRAAVDEFIRGTDNWPTPGKIRAIALEFAEDAYRQSTGLRIGNSLIYGSLSGSQPDPEKLKAVREMLERKQEQRLADLHSQHIVSPAFDPKEKPLPAMSEEIRTRLRTATDNARRRNEAFLQRLLEADQ